MLANKERARVRRTGLQGDGAIRDYRRRRYTTTRIGFGGSARKRRDRVGEFVLQLLDHCKRLGTFLRNSVVNSTEWQHW